MEGDMMLGVFPVQWMLATQLRVFESIMKDDDVAGDVLRNEICENQYDDLSINPLKRSCKTGNHPRRFVNDRQRKMQKLFLVHVFTLWNLVTCASYGSDAKCGIQERHLLYHESNKITILLIMVAP